MKKIIISIIILLSILLYNYKFNLLFRVWLLNRLVISRGVLAPNCKWLQISDLLIGDDGSGINLYNTYKEKYGDFAESNMYGEKVYVITKNKYMFCFSIKTFFQKMIHKFHQSAKACIEFHFGKIIRYSFNS